MGEWDRPVGVIVLEFICFQAHLRKGWGINVPPVIEVTVEKRPKNYHRVCSCVCFCVGGCTRFVHGRSRKTIDPRIPASYAGMEHVGFSPTRQALLAPCGRGVS